MAVCSLCYETTCFFGKGVCGHSEVCWLCTLRLRWICKDICCALCKTSLDEIEIVEIGKTGHEVVFRDVVFHSEQLLRDAHRLVEFHCPYCASFQFRSLRDLQTHLKRDHGELYCTVCLDHRQCFLPEQELFTQLSVHMQQAHPSCGFCRGEHFYSSDELLVHMQQAHFKCVVCERLDFRNEYYAHCAALSDHFSESHFPCMVPECVEQRFVVFADEEELRLHAAERHGGRVTLGGGSKRRQNKFTVDRDTVHFRGPKVPNTQQRAVISDRYPDLSTGCVYDRNVHSKIEKNKEKTISVKLDKEVKMDDYAVKSRIEQLIALSAAQRQTENVAFLGRLKRVLSEEELGRLKQFAGEFRAGHTDVRSFLASTAQFPKDILADLVGLMPDAAKRSEVLKCWQTVELPMSLWETPLPGGEKRPCLIHALNAVLAAKSGSTVIAQSTLHAMENKINGLDRIQLSTLSEMRDHLLILGDASWVNTDELISLRPLLYRLMRVPDSHKHRAAELIAQGWTQFVTRAEGVIGKFSHSEIAWIKAYLSLCAMRLATIGPLDARRRTDFPAIKSSVYFPSIPQPVAVVVPTSVDFPSSLVTSDPIRRASGWQNSASSLRDEVFPQLATTSPAPVSINWACSRCTFLNTRMLALSCEICGKERAESQEPNPPVTNPLRSKRNKQKVILSSSTQRDYTR